jgi:putative transposase
MDKSSAGYTTPGFPSQANVNHLETGSQPLSRFMQGLARSLHPVLQPQAPQGGHLFQGRYKAIVREKDEYLLGLVRYIHHNPIRAHMVRKVDEYRYSGTRVT